MERKPQIVDVRIQADAPEAKDASASEDLRKQIIQGLSKPLGERTLPTMLLYSERGLRLYDMITTKCPEYYLFPAEEEILKENSDAIVQAMLANDEVTGHVENTVVIELGAGALRKTSRILLSLAKHVHARPHIYNGLAPSSEPLTYFALDLEKAELERTLTELMANHGDDLDGKVATKGMWGTYDGGIKYIQEGGLKTINDHDSPPPQVSLNENIRAARFELRDNDDQSHQETGSSASTRGVSMSTREDSITPPSSPSSDGESKHFQAAPLRLMFLGSSLGNFDRASATKFLKGLPLRPGSGDSLLIGLDHDNSAEDVELAYNDPRGITKDFIMQGLKEAGKVLGEEDLFEKGKWEYANHYNVEARRHEAYYKSTQDQTIRVPGSEEVFKFSAGELVNVEISLKFSEEDAHSMFIDANLRPMMRWTDKAGRYSLWLLERPEFTFPRINRPGAFGVPTLEDFKVMWQAWDAITLGMIPRGMLFTKPIDLRHICLFYLGHIPAFLDIHLSRVFNEPHTEPENFKSIFERGIDPHVDDPNQCHPHSEVPQNDEDWPTLEQIISFRDNVRTRLTRVYDDIASGKRKLTRKVGRVLFMMLEHEGFHAETLLYMLLQGAGKPGGTVPPPGFATPQWELLAKQWNAVKPPAHSMVTLGPETVVIGHNDPEELDEVERYKYDLKDVEYGWDNEHPERQVRVEQFRIEWRPVTNGEFYEFYQVEGKDMVKLPASWVEIDGQIQVRTLYGPIPMKIAQNWPLLTSYDDLSKYAQVKGGRLPTEAELRLFFDKFESGYEGGSNVGFRNWHPVPATMGGVANGGKGHNGGVWEWTSTVFDMYDGFYQSRVYPGYSSDFFDGKHQVVIGGSYATIPNLSERRSVRNYYQHNYPYPWVAGRIVYDA